MDQQNSCQSKFNKSADDRPKSTVRKTFIYILCATILAVYFFALYLGRQTDVSREYRMYYIEGLLTDWPGEGKFQYNIGTKEYIIEYNKYKKTDKSLCLRKGEGWEEKSSVTGTLNSDSSSNIYYPMTEDLINGAKVTLEVTAIDGDKDLSVYYQYTDENNKELITLQKDDDLFDEKIQTKKLVGKINKKGKYTFNLPKTYKGDLCQLIFISHNTNFRLWTVQIDAENISN